MNFALSLALCLTFAFVAHSEGGWEAEHKNAQRLDEEVALDEEPGFDKRVIGSPCQSNADCGRDECCCRRTGVCQALKSEGQLCNPRSIGCNICRAGLYCRLVQRVFQCARLPTTPPSTV